MGSAWAQQPPCCAFKTFKQVVPKTVGQEGKWDAGVRDQVKAGLGGSISFGFFFSFK